LIYRNSLFKNIQWTYKYTAGPEHSIAPVLVIYNVSRMECPTMQLHKLLIKPVKPSATLFM